MQHIATLSIYASPFRPLRQDLPFILGQFSNWWQRKAGKGSQVLVAWLQTRHCIGPNKFYNTYERSHGVIIYKIIFLQNDFLKFKLFRTNHKSFTFVVALTQCVSIIVYRGQVRGGHVGGSETTDGVEKLPDIMKNMVMKILK